MKKSLRMGLGSGRVGNTNLVCSGGGSQQNYEFQVLTLLSGVQSTHVMPKLEHLENLLPVLLLPRFKYIAPRIDEPLTNLFSKIFGPWLRHHHLGPCPTFAGSLSASPCQPLFSCVCPLWLVRLTRNYPEISRGGISWWTKADLLSLEDFSHNHRQLGINGWRLTREIKVWKIFPSISFFCHLLKILSSFLRVKCVSHFAQRYVGGESS